MDIERFTNTQPMWLMAIDLDRTNTRAAPVLCHDRPLVSELITRMCQALTLGVPEECGVIDSGTQLLLPYESQLELACLTQPIVLLAAGQTVTIECPLLVFGKKGVLRHYECLSDEEFNGKYMEKIQHNAKSVDLRGCLLEELGDPPSIRFPSPVLEQQQEQPECPPPLSVSFFDAVPQSTTHDPTTLRRTSSDPQPSLPIPPPPIQYSFF